MFLNSSVQLFTANVEFLKLKPQAILPSRATEFSAGLDLYSSVNLWILPKCRAAVNTGLRLKMPFSVYVRIAPRSGIANSHGIDVLAGVIDQDYQGEIKVILINYSKTQ